MTYIKNLLWENHMPNICENKLEITTTNQNLVRWIQNFCEKGEVEYDDFSPCPPTGLFQHIAPMPSELEGTTKGNKPPQWQVDSSEALIDAYGADNWYDWQCKNWGTKWDVYCNNIKEWYIDHLDNGNYFVFLEFDTAWGPPTEAIKRLKMSYGAQISFLRILYVAEGDFCGIYNARTGEQIEDTEFVDYPDLPKLAAKYEEKETDEWEYGWIQEEVEDRVNEVAEYHNERLKEVDNEQKGPDVQVRTRFTETEDGSSIWDEYDDLDPEVNNG